MKKSGDIHIHIQTTPTRGRIIVADGIYSVGDKNVLSARKTKKIKETKKKFGRDYLGGKRKSKLEEYIETGEVPIEALIEKEPITVVCSKMGWIRAMTGHIDLERELKFKDGDGPNIIFHAETTDRILIFGSNGRFYTIFELFFLCTIEVYVLGILL